MDERISRTGAERPVNVNPNFIDPISDDGTEYIQNEAPSGGIIASSTVNEASVPEYNSMRSKYIDPISDFDSDTLDNAVSAAEQKDSMYNYSDADRIKSEEEISGSDEIGGINFSTEATDTEADVIEGQSEKTDYSQYVESRNNEKIKQKYEYLRQPLSDDELENLPDGGYAKAVRDSQKNFLSKKVFSAGDSKPLFVLTLINGALYAVWFVAYILCTIIRAAAFASAEQQMMLTGQLVYTVKVSSPLFGILKVFAIILPLLIIAWIIYVALTDKKKKAVPDKRLLTAVMIIDAVCAATAAVDIMFLHMIFV